MAFEAPMEAWFADLHASRPEENAEKEADEPVRCGEIEE
jgi:hypothetical protein